MRLRIGIVALFFMALSASSTIIAQTTMEQDKAAITAVSKARAAAFNAMNAENIAVHFTEDGALMAPGMQVVTGRKAVAAYYQTIFDAFDVVLDSFYEEVEVSGDMAYGRGEAIVTATDRKYGTTSVAKSKYLNILKRQKDGSWETTHDIWNSNDSSKE